MDITRVSLSAGRKAKLGKISKQDSSYIEKTLSRTIVSDVVSNKQESAGSKELLSTKGKTSSKSASMALLSELVEGDPLSAEEMKLAGRELDGLPDLSVCKSLRRLDVSNNKLENLEFLSNCRDITWLSIKDNQIQDLTHLKRLWHLQMLNLGGNKVEILDALSKMSELKALIANNNSIRSFDGLGLLTNLSTIVMSHNSITEIAGIKSLRLLTKLSIAHNQIRVIPDLSAHPLLEELRLNDNKIMRIPDTIDRNPELRLVDLGRNRLFDISDVHKLSKCRKLHNLNLFGNTKLCELPGYREKAISSIPQLVILDGRRVDESKAPKKKKAALDPSRSKKDPNKPSHKPDQCEKDAELSAPQAPTRKGAVRVEEDKGCTRPGAGNGPAAEATQKSKEVHAGTEAHNEFVKNEIRRLRAADPSLDHRSAFKQAAENWHKLHRPHVAGAPDSAKEAADSHPMAAHGSTDSQKGGDADRSTRKRSKGEHVEAQDSVDAPQREQKKLKQGIPAAAAKVKGRTKGTKGEAQDADEVPIPKPRVVEVRDGWESAAALPAARATLGGVDGEAAPEDDAPESQPHVPSSGVVAIRLLTNPPTAKPLGAKKRSSAAAMHDNAAASLGQAVQVGLGGDSAWD